MGSCSGHSHVKQLLALFDEVTKDPKVNDLLKHLSDLIDNDQLTLTSQDLEFLSYRAYDMDTFTANLTAFIISHSDDTPKKDSVRKCQSPPLRSTEPPRDLEARRSDRSCGQSLSSPVASSTSLSSGGTDFCESCDGPKDDIAATEVFWTTITDRRKWTANKTEWQATACKYKQRYSRVRSKLSRTLDNVSRGVFGRVEEGLCDRMRRLMQHPRRVFVKNADVQTSVAELKGQSKCLLPSTSGDDLRASRSFVHMYKSVVHKLERHRRT